LSKLEALHLGAVDQGVAFFDAHDLLKCEHAGPDVGTLHGG